ncbi:MAG: class I SAM-dependent methyltransferase [Anaerolineae bacterium]
MTNIPTSINYDAASQTYDLVRRPDVALVERLVAGVELTPESTVLDIGCGTGNYADLLQRVTGAQIYGVDPSVGMLEKARTKNPAIICHQSTADQLPFDNTFFDLVYMTDVIHHIPDMHAMFTDIHRALKVDGKVCIVTQSHAQIDRRPIVTFFPSTASVDKARYPDLPQIVASARQVGLHHFKTDTVFAGDPVELGEDFLELVRHKGYSMLRLISQEEYVVGLKNLQAQLELGDISAHQAGETLLWFQK